MLSTIEITAPQIEKVRSYGYGLKHYFYGVFLLPMLCLAIYFLWDDISQGQVIFKLFSGFMVFLLCYLILSFNTKTTCDQDGLTATCLFIINRKVLWKNIQRMQITAGRASTCKIHSNESLFSIRILLGSFHALKDEGRLLATIIERANLSLNPEAKQGEIDYVKLVTDE
jgi:hypothetical protein